MTELSKAIKRLEDTLEITDGGEHMIVKTLDVAVVLSMLQLLSPTIVWLLWFDGHVAAPAVFESERAAKSRVIECEHTELEWRESGLGTQLAEGKQVWFLRERAVRRESQAVPHG